MGAGFSERFRFAPGLLCRSFWGTGFLRVSPGYQRLPAQVDAPVKNPAPCSLIKKLSMNRLPEFLSPRPLDQDTMLSKT